MVDCEKKRGPPIGGPLFFSSVAVASELTLVRRESVLRLRGARLATPAGEEQKFDPSCPVSSPHPAPLSQMEGQLAPPSGVQAPGRPPERKQVLAQRGYRPVHQISIGPQPGTLKERIAHTGERSTDEAPPDEASRLLVDQPKATKPRADATRRPTECPGEPAN